MDSDARECAEKEDAERNEEETSETAIADTKAHEAEVNDENEEYSSSDKKYIFETQESPVRRLPPKVVNNWRLFAMLICWVNLVLSVLFGVLLFVFSVEDSSSSAFGFAMTALLNAMTSAVVIWRYYGALSAYSERKEDRALVTLGSLFILSAICTGGSALYYILTNARADFSERAANQLIIVSIVATVSLTVIAATQMFVAKRLASCTLLTDALNSLAGAIVALSVAISYRIGEDQPMSWYLDEVIGIVIACFLFVYGVALLGKYLPVLLRSNRYEET